MRTPKTDWSKVDWKNGIMAAAQAAGVKYQSAYTQYRKTHSRICNFRLDKRNWQDYDWSKSNKEICSETGCCQAQVSAARKKHAPNTIRKIIQTK